MKDKMGRRVDKMVKGEIWVEIITRASEYKMYIIK